MPDVGNHQARGIEGINRLDTGGVSSADSTTGMISTQVYEIPVVLGVNEAGEARRVRGFHVDILDKARGRIRKGEECEVVEECAAAVVCDLLVG